MKKALLPIITFARIDIKRLFRDKVGIFFVFLFPLIFLFVFGGLFGGEDETSFKIALLNNANTDSAKQFVENANQAEMLEVQSSITTLEQARQKMNRGEIHATIILPESFGTVQPGATQPSGKVEVLHDTNNAQAAQVLTSILNDMFQQVNKQFVDVRTPFTATAVSTASEGLRQFDFIFSGLLGFTLLSLGIFGPTTVFPKLKERGVLRRYHTTTLRVWQYFVANVLSNAAVGLMAAGLMLLVALTVFNLNMRGDYISLAVVTVIGVVLMFGIGLAVGGWAKNENQAAPLSQIISFPMMFLSGVFFPTFMMPEWLQSITRFIPLTPVIDSIRLIITESKTIFELGPQLGIMAAWIVVIYIVAFRVFRWE